MMINQMMWVLAVTPANPKVTQVLKINEQRSIAL
jgi:hypothetical protein